MTLLAGFPPIDQLHESTVDGAPDENAANNCVATSLAAVLTYLLGQPYTGDQLKDAVYGEGYTGVLSAASFSDYCAAHGVIVTKYVGAGTDLVTAIHAALAENQPVLVTMPSAWNQAPGDPMRYTGSTHVGVACGDGPGWVRVMNPWGGFWQDEPDGWWAARLCYGAVWLCRRAEVRMMTIAEFATANPWVGQPVEPVRTTDYGQECCYTNAIIGWKSDGGAFLGDAGRQLYRARQQFAALNAPPDTIRRALALVDAIKALS